MQVFGGWSGLVPRVSHWDRGQDRLRGKLVEKVVLIWDGVGCIWEWMTREGDVIKTASCLPKSILFISHCHRVVAGHRLPS